MLRNSAFSTVLCLLCSVSGIQAAVTQPAINMAGTWQFTLSSATTPAPITYSGAFVQTANSLTGFAPFSVSGSSCSNSASGAGTISDTGALSLTFTVNGETRSLSGTVAPSGDSASGTFTSSQGGCLIGNSSIWTATRTQQVLSQFAFGGGWYSAIYFANAGSTPAPFTVTFTSDLGVPLVVPALGGSSITVTVPANGTAIVEAPNVGDLVEGWVSFALPGGVTGYGVFRQSGAGIADQEAVVPLASSSTTSNTLIWDDTAFTTAVAAANPSNIPIVLVIEVHDHFGTLIGTATVPLGAKAKAAFTLRGLFGGVMGTRGTAVFSVTSGNVTVLGLRFSGAAFTSIPTTTP